MPHPIIAKMRTLRKKLGLSQPALATRAGIPTRMISKMESGATKSTVLDALNQIAAALDCKLSLVPRAHREHSQYTIDKASAVVCSICEAGLEVGRSRVGIWIHSVSGKAVKCYASDLREALFEPITDKDADVQKHYRDKETRQRQRINEKRSRARNRSDEKEQKMAQNQLRVAEILKKLRRN